MKTREFMGGPMEGKLGSTVEALKGTGQGDHG